MNIIILLALAASEVLSTKLNPLSDEFINLINSKQNTWTAGRNFDKNTSIEDIKILCGVKGIDPRVKTITKFVHSEDIDIPESFDVREHWPECKDVISQIADQSACGSCWAVSTASAMSDRRCIASKGKLQIPVSALDVLSCCLVVGDKGCGGGFPIDAWNNWFANGYVTGGLYNSSQGCKPYSMQPCEHYIPGDKIQCSTLKYTNPQCVKKCDDESIIYENDLTFAADETKAFMNNENVQREILTNGPVVATIDVFEDFVHYKKGVYKFTEGEYAGGHAVRILGWGVENDTPYWLVANSWNEDWGDNGYIKVRRGTNEIGIEAEILASLPKV